MYAYILSHFCFLLQNSLIAQPPQPADSPGRSGAKFFISFDRKLVIKSITTEEVALLHLILQAYHAVSNPFMSNIPFLVYYYCSKANPY